MSYIGNPIVQAAFVTDTFSGTGSATAFILSVAPANNAAALVAISGVVQDPSTYGVAGTTITFSAPPPSGTNNISVRCLGIPVTGVTTTAYRTIIEITATASQTTFTPASYTVGFLNVYQNGVLLGSADYTASNGTSVVLATGATVGDLLLFESFNVSSVLNAIPATTGAVSPSYLAAAGASKAFLDTANSNGTGALTVPTGTTAQRPASPVAGQIRYNSTLNSTEIYSGVAWISITTQTYSVSYLLVAGGGSSGKDVAGIAQGGGGGGGLISNTATLNTGTAYTITVGAGGASGSNGADSVISSINTATGGGRGGANTTGFAGGSGGGGSASSSPGTPNTGGAGTSGQGFAGGSGVTDFATYNSAGGGGGAGATGGNSSTAGGTGGNGSSNSISGSSVTYAGGGGGGGSANSSAGGAGGTGGGGAGTKGTSVVGTAGTANLGGGGGGGDGATAAAGGSGIAIISYTGSQRGTGGTVTSSGGNTIHTFTSSGTYTA
jgi:hypothetical protein